MRFCVLASGSEGNCILVEDAGNTAVLVDAGLSMRRIADHLAAKERDFSRIRGLLISHEHADHLRGAAVLARRLDLPIYASAGTLTLIKRYLPDTIRLFSLNGNRLRLGSMAVESFQVNHDASEAVGFIFREGARRLVIATDLGIVDLATLNNLRDCDAIVLESNHDAEMLISGPYPWDLKRRIQSHQGHLSNDQAAEALLKIVTPRLKRVVLAHLSQENNRPHLALERVQSQLHDAGHTHVEIVVADQHSPTDVFELKD